VISAIALANLVQKAVTRLRDIAQGNISAGLVEQNELALI
jgi:hypothetical protein